MPKTQERPKTSGPGGGNDERLIHSLPLNTPVEPGAKALCGTRIKGIPASRHSGLPLCTMCESLRKSDKLPGFGP